MDSFGNKCERIRTSSHLVHIKWALLYVWIWIYAYILDVIQSSHDGMLHMIITHIEKVYAQFSECEWIQSVIEMPSIIRRRVSKESNLFIIEQNTIPIFESWKDNFVNLLSKTWYKNATDDVHISNKSYVKWTGIDIHLFFYIFLEAMGHRCIFEIDTPSCSF